MGDYKQTANTIKSQKLLTNMDNSKQELFKPMKYNIFDKNMVTMPTGRTDLSSQPMFQRDANNSFTFASDKNR